MVGGGIGGIFGDHKLKYEADYAGNDAPPDPVIKPVAAASKSVAHVDPHPVAKRPESACTSVAPFYYWSEQEIER